MSQRPTKLLASFLSFFISIFDKKVNHCNASIWQALRKWRETSSQATQDSFPLFALVLFMCFSDLAGAQVAPGAPSFVPQDCHEVDCVDLLNNNITLHLPIRSKTGAWAFNSGISANYYYSINSSATWAPPSSGNGTAWNSSVNGALSSSTQPALVPTAGMAVSANCTGSGTTVESYDYAVRSPDGTLHPLPTTVYTDKDGVGNSCITGSGFTASTIDGSGLVAVVSANGTTFSIYSKDGAELGGSSAPSSIKDRNGNTMAYSSPTYTDTMGLTALTVSGTYPANTFTWTDVKGGSPDVAVTTASKTLATYFQCPGISEYSGSASLPTSISYPDGTSVGLTYEVDPHNSADVTGRINQITLREGGTVSYTYGGMVCAYQATSLTRTLGNGDVTTYGLTWSLNSNGYYTAANTVIDPGGNQTIYTFSGLTSTGNLLLPQAQVVSEVQHYQGHGTGAALLSTDLYSYNTAFTSSPSASTISAKVTSFPITSLVVYHQPAGMSTWSATAYTFDGGSCSISNCYGNVTYMAQYDFGGASPARSKTITYGSCTSGCNTSSPTISNSSMAANYIFDKPGLVVTQQNGSAVAQAAYTYDAKGNLDYTELWTGLTWAPYIGQTSSNTYNLNGTLATSYDLNNNETTYAYVAGSYSDTCSGATQYPFPTKITNVGTGLYTQATYDCEGGVKLTDVDANGNTTTYGYKTSGGTADPFWRVSSVTDPLLNVAYKTYPTGSNPLSSGTSFTFNSGNSIHQTDITTDGWGRPVLSQRAQSPTGSNYDTVSTTYFWSSTYQGWNTSQPCSVAAGTNCSGQVHTFFNDALGRFYGETTSGDETLSESYVQQSLLTELAPAPTGENVKATSTVYDGLGRVSSVCHVGSTAVTGSGTACPSPNSSYNGAVDTYTYGQGSGYTSVSVKRAGTQTRTYIYDALGRIEQRVTPEGGSWLYYYDSKTGCTKSYGNLVCAIDANGNDLAWVYDALNRLTAAGANNTACKHFFYDNTTGYSGTIPTGITLSNQYGRLAEAVTDNCSGTLITDEWFNYDKDGHTLTQWQKTPHSTQYYESKATFFGNGAINTLQLASPSLYTLTYGLDGEGRWNTVYTGAQYYIVTGTTFSPAAGTGAGGPIQIKLTGTTPDQDNYTYDPNTGKMLTFQFKVGNTPVSESGTLTWNQNRSLKTLAITDGFNSGGTQTCNDTYDDWERLTVYDCGSGNWGQDFSYDIYSNLSKAVISGRSGSAWNPGYSSSTNHYTCGGCTYDSDGDVTYDGNNSYQWNGFEKLASTVTGGSGTPTCGTSGECLTYDAFGRVVEFSYNGSSWEELQQLQGGAVQSYVSGTTANYGRFPGPAGGTIVTGGNVTLYWAHKDWIGNARITSNINTNAWFADKAYTPFGEIYSAFGSAITQQTDFFAGTSTAFNPLGVTMWDTPNRELSIVGRWLSPDPANSGWNQYEYAGSNPNSNVDRTGLSSYSSGCGSECPFTEPAWVYGYAGDAVNAAAMGEMEFQNEVALLMSTAQAAINSLTVNSTSVGADASGQYTGTYEPPGWNGGQQQDWTSSPGSEGASWLSVDEPTLLAQNLPPAANGPAWAAKQATRPYPKQTPPPATRPVPDPNQAPKMEPNERWWMRLWGMFDFSDTPPSLIFMVDPVLLDPNKLHCEETPCGT